MKSYFLCLIAGTGLALSLAGCGGKSRQFEASSPEMKVKIEAEMQREIASHDINKDGILTCADVSDERAREFAKADEDGSETLDAAEYHNLRWYDKLYVLLELSNDDRDGDGVVTLAELQARPDPFFTRVDQNKDCTITPQELRAGLDQAGFGQNPPRGERPRRITGGELAQ